MRLSDFKVLSFDCYGTLIDWETGLLDALGPLTDRLDRPPGRDAVLKAFAHFEAMQQRNTPIKPYRDILATVYKRLAEAWRQPASWDACLAFGHTIGAWPAFPDSAEALAYLKTQFKLVILSNVDNASFALSNARLGVSFDAVYTAEDIGSYKPDHKNFAYMLDHITALGHQKSAVLHVAHSLYHDHVAASELGLARCWIDRHSGQEAQGATPLPDTMPALDFHFHSLAGLAAAHRGEKSSNKA